MAIRPEKVKLSRRAPAADGPAPHAFNRLEGVITDVSYLGGLTTYKVKLDSGAVVRSSMANTTRIVDRLRRRPARGGLVHARRLPGAGTMSARRIFARPARLAAIAPYVWMVLFFLVPFGFVLKIALSQTAIAQPPYTPVFDLWADGKRRGQRSSNCRIDNFKLLISDNLYILSYLRSLTVALVSTAILLADRLSRRLRHGAAAAALAGRLR